MADRPDMGEVEVDVEPTPAPEPEKVAPAPVAAPEPKEEEPPDWLNAPIPDESPYVPPQFPQYAPMPQYAPQMPPAPYPGYQPIAPMTPQQRAEFDWRAFADRPQEVLTQQVMQSVLPIAARLQQLDAQIQQVNAQAAQMNAMNKRQHEEQIVEGFNTARTTLAKAYKNGFSKDPAYANPQVRQTLDGVLRGYLRDAVTRAYTNQDFSGLRNLSDPRVLQTAWAGAKLMAGWQDGGNAVNIQGAFLETSRSQPGASRPDLDDDERDAAGELARRMGVDRSVVEKKMVDGKEKIRKMGW